MDSSRSPESCCHYRCVGRGRSCHRPCVCSARAHIGLRGRDRLEGAREEVEAAGGRALVLPRMLTA
jgi:hypothetical protein